MIFRVSVCAFFHFRISSIPKSIGHGIERPMKLIIKKTILMWELQPLARLIQSVRIVYSHWPSKLRINLAKVSVARVRCRSQYMLHASHASCWCEDVLSIGVSTCSAKRWPQRRPKENDEVIQSNKSCQPPMAISSSTRRQTQSHRVHFRNSTEYTRSSLPLSNSVFLPCSLDLNFGFIQLLICYTIRKFIIPTSHD